MKTKRSKNKLLLKLNKETIADLNVQVMVQIKTAGGQIKQADDRYINDINGGDGTFTCRPDVTDGGITPCSPCPLLL